MGKMVLAFIVTVICGVGGLLLGNTSDIPIPELGSIIAVAVMGVFILRAIDKKNK